MIEIGPGMARTGRCSECDGPLAVDDGERCAQCRSQLSVMAEEIGRLRKQKRDLITAM
jgi:predicted amidophosphoribosyltransferase